MLHNNINNIRDIRSKFSKIRSDIIRAETLSSLKLLERRIKKIIRIIGFKFKDKRDYNIPLIQSITQAEADRSLRLIKTKLSKITK